MINDLYIKIISCKAEDQKFSIGFVVPSLKDMQVMAYLLTLVLEGKGTLFGPMDAKSVTEEFQNAYYKALAKFPTIIQWEMEFSISVDYFNKKQSFECKFRDKESENMNIDLLCVNSDAVGIRLDFHAVDDANLKSACAFIYMILRGKGAKDDNTYAHIIYEQLNNAFFEYKKNDIRTKVDDISFLYALMYETGEQRFICYSN